MPTDVITSAGNSITLSVNKNILTTVNTQSSSVSLEQGAPLQAVVNGPLSSFPISVPAPTKSKLTVKEIQGTSVSLSPRSPVSVELLHKGPKGDQGERGADGVDGVDGGGLESLFADPSPKLGSPLDVNGFNLYTRVTGGDIRFTPHSTGSINLDGTVKFKRFEVDAPPTPFAGGMYADKDDNLYFGVDE